jgi:hypothetical protein
MPEDKPADKPTEKPNPRQLLDALKSLTKRTEALMRRDADAEEPSVPVDLSPEDIGQMFDLLLARVPLEERKDFLDLHLSGFNTATTGDSARSDKHPPSNDPTAPVQTAADSRADSRRRYFADAHREAQRDDEARLEAQSDYDRCFYAIEGSRAPLPLAGERSHTYRVRMLRGLQKYSDEHKGVDLASITDPKLFEVIDRRIRADALQVAHNPEAMQKYFGAVSEGLREVIEEDPRTGRKISRFVGPVSACLAPFRLPSMRAVFDRDLLREGRRRG